MQNWRVVLGGAMANAEFWYEFASTYSYPAALRVGALATERGVSLAWRPFLLGPIFAAQGWRDFRRSISTPPRPIHVARRRADLRGDGRPVHAPSPLPQASLLAARVALALEGAERANFSRRVYEAEFGQGASIADRATLASLLAACGIDAAATLERAETEANKAALKAECARASEIGIVGAPSLVTSDGEVFWGNDRLEQGLDWAAGRR